MDENDVPVGSASVSRDWSDWNAGFYWWIQCMYIAPAYRGRGLMDTLLEAVTSAATEEGCLDLRLYVHSSNSAAIRAYEKAGFENSAYAIMTRAVPPRT